MELSCIYFRFWFHKSYCLYVKILYLWRSLPIPWIEPTIAATEMRKHTKLKSWSMHHFSVSFFMCLWAMCICMGKKTTRGQNPIAPSRERISLKNGIAMARIVDTITKMVLQISLNRLKLIVTLPNLVGYSLFMKSDCGHTMFAPISTIRKNGCPITCNKILISRIY